MDLEEEINKLTREEIGLEEFLGKIRAKGGDYLISNIMNSYTEGVKKLVIYLSDDDSQKYFKGGDFDFDCRFLQSKKAMRMFNELNSKKDDLHRKEEIEINDFFDNR